MPSLKSRAIHLLVNSVPRWSRYAHRAYSVLKPRHKAINFYWSASCPYSYVMAQQLQRLTAGLDVRVNTLPIPLGAADVDPAPELRRAHGPRDCASLAAFYDLDFPTEWSFPGEAAITRASRIAIKADSLDACVDIGRALWSGDEARLSTLAASLGESEAAPAQETLTRNAAHQRARGHYHPGTVSYLGEWFEGPMRMELLVERLRSEDRTPAPPWSRSPAQHPGSTTSKPSFEMWFSFRSPYSYLAIAQLQQWRERGEVFEVEFRPVLPMVMRGLAVPKAKKMYLVTDAAREARRLGVPFGHIADPLGAGAERCLALCAALTSNDGHTRRAFDFAVSASAGIWSEDVDIATDEGLLTMADRAGIAADEVMAALADNKAGLALAESNRKQLFEAGVWGVPSFRSGDFTTWGQDRLDLLRQRIGLGL